MEWSKCYKCVWLFLFLGASKVKMGTVQQVYIKDNNIPLVGSSIQIICKISGFADTDVANIYKTESKPPTDLSVVPVLVSCTSSMCLGTAERHTFSSDQNKVSIIVNNLIRSEDQKWWTCAINSQRKEMHLTVYTIAKTLQFDNPPSQEQDLAENEVMLKCSTGCAYPSPSFTWYYIESDNSRQRWTTSNNVTETAGGCSDMEIIYTSTLTLARYTVFNGSTKTTAAKFQCGILSVTGTKDQLFTPISKNITFAAVPDGPPVIQGYASGGTYNITETSLGFLSCSVKGGNPLAVLRWDCYNTGSNSETVDTTVTKNVSWTASRGQDRSCTCNSTHPAARTQSVYVNVNVLYPPDSPIFKVNNKSVSGSISFIEGNERSVVCESRAKPSPDTYNWTNGSTTREGNTLTFNRVQKGDEALYKCSVQNKMILSSGVQTGRNSSSVHIAVLFPPTKPVLKYSSQDGATLPGSFKVVKGDSFDMHCFSTAKPTPSYLWTGDGRNVSNQVIAVSSITKDRIYTCKVKNTMEPTFQKTVSGSSSTTVSISVLSPPTTPTKTYHYSLPGSILVSTNMAVIKGKSFNVSCAAIAIPPPTLSWSGPKTSTSGTLMFTSVLESHDGTYKCTARNNMIRTFGEREEGTSVSSLKIQVLYAPSVTPFNVDPIVEGDKLSVQCNSAPGNPASRTYSWKRKLSSSSGNTWQDIPVSTVNEGQLQKQDINRNDAGTYRCTASNVMKPTAEKEQTGSSSQIFILNVLYKASISGFFVVNHPTSNEVTVSEHSSVTLHCEVDSNPGSRIDILKHGEIETSKENTKQITYSNSKVSCDTAGIFSCVGYNDHNTEANRPKEDLRLFVTCSPRLKSPEDFEKDITSALNKEASLKITVVAYPIPKEYIWQKRNGNAWEILTNDDSIRINSSGLDSTLTIVSVMESDFQQYRVNVSNSFGHFIQEFFLNPQDKPKPPENVNFMDGSLTKSSAVITWNPGFDGGLEQTFVLQYKKQGGPNWLEKTKEDDGTESMNITLTGLAIGTKYAFQMYSKNSEGNSSATNVLYFTTRKKTDPGGSSAAMIGGAAGGSVVAVILIAGIVVFLVRRGSFKKGKSKATSERSDREPVYEDENDYGMQDNPMYVSAGPRQPNSKAGKSSTGDGAKYSTVNRTTEKRAADDQNDNEYAVVKKTNKAKAKPDKKEKSKQVFFKDKKGKKADLEGDIYENSPSKNLKAAASKDETIYENPESSVLTKTKNVNKDGLIYADLTFNDQPKGQKKLVIHGLDSMTEYVQVDFTKKADPLPESDDENIPPKN